MKIEITYKNGNKIENKINYLHFENGCIYFTVDRKVHDIIRAPVEIPLASIENWHVTHAKSSGR